MHDQWLVSLVISSITSPWLSSLVMRIQYMECIEAHTHTHKLACSGSFLSDGDGSVENYSYQVNSQCTINKVCLDNNKLFQDCGRQWKLRQNVTPCRDVWNSSDAVNEQHYSIPPQHSVSTSQAAGEGPGPWTAMAEYHSLQKLTCHRVGMKQGKPLMPTYFTWTV